jgi:hypothetical protein
LPWRFSNGEALDAASRAANVNVDKTFIVDFKKLVKEGRSEQVESLAL